MGPFRLLACATDDEFFAPLQAGIDSSQFLLPKGARPGECAHEPMDLMIPTWQPLRIGARDKECNPMRSSYGSQEDLQIMDIAREGLRGHRPGLTTTAMILWPLQPGKLTSLWIDQCSDCKALLN
jgi:hypothetical protein